MRKFYSFLGGIAVLFITSCQHPTTTVKYATVQGYLINQLDQSIQLTEGLLHATSKHELIDAFKNARIAFKKAEPFTAIINAESTHHVNGPPLPVFNEDSGEVLPPVGFQAIGEQVFAEELDSALFNFQVAVTIGYLENLKEMSLRFPINHRRFFPAIHQQFLSIFSLGLSGFDTPSSCFGIHESAHSLRSIGEIYTLSLSDTVKLLNAKLDQQFVFDLEAAAHYLEAHNDFATLNRYEFGREHLNRLTRDWVAIRQLTGLYSDPKTQALNLDAPTFFEENSMNVAFFRANSTRNPSEKQVVLGEKLFHDPRLSSSNNLSCGSCHRPNLAFQDGYPKSPDKDGKLLLRNTPTLLNSIYQKKFFWDGRCDNLEQQIASVFASKAEFNQNAHSIQSSAVVSDRAYQMAFAKAYPDQPLNRSVMIDALSSYVSTLNAMNSRFDRNMRGELADFTEQEILGMNVFMGKALCATCHFIPLTNGTVPPLFRETEKEVLGTPATPENLKIDSDSGFYWVYQKAIHKYMFKTPTIRNVALTAPYMHNGVYDSLEQVMDFYNQGGGAGLGFDVPHQTLPFDSLSLTDAERKAVIAFMKTFTDTYDQAGNVLELTAYTR